MSNTPPVIIMGHPRSGSTFFTAVVNSHPRVFITDESRIFVSIHRAAKELRARDLVQPPAWKPIMMSHMRQAVLEVYEKWSEKEDLSEIVWGDSFPHYCDSTWGNSIPEIEALFPNAKYVFLTRGKDAVLKSLAKLKWPGSPDWYDDLREAGMNAKAQLGDRLLWLEYENGIEQNAKEFFKHVNLPLHPKVEAKIRKELDHPTRYSSPTSW